MRKRKIEYKELRCYKHPRYDATKKPDRKCFICNLLWNVKNAR